MNILIPDYYAEVTRQEFEHLIGNLDYRRDGYADGEYYFVLAPPLCDGRIGLHLTAGDKYFVNPEFFKKSS